MFQLKNVKKILIISLLFVKLLALDPDTKNENCSTYNSDYPCTNTSIYTWPDEWDERVFQTPPRGVDYWREGYQDMHLLVGYLQQKYNAAHDEVTFTFITRINTKELGENVKILYKFGDEPETDQNFMVFTKAEYKGKYLDGMPISCRIPGDENSDIATLKLENEYFLWNAPEVHQPESYENGQKGAIVEFFGWPYPDIEEECPFLAKAGYMAAKVFPAAESILTYDTVENGEMNPWWFLYQPVSYRLTSRMGTKTELKKMIDTCRSLGVRVYVDAVINHMTGNGNDMYPDHRNKSGGCVHWGPKNGSDKSPWWTVGWRYEPNPYTGLKPGVEYPSVPYTSSDFHCERACNRWTDPENLNVGWLSGLIDLRSEKDYVRQRIADYLTELMSIGVSGIRWDAAKHMAPRDISAILAKLKENMGGVSLPEDFTAYLEVLMGNEKDFLLCNDNWYSYGVSFAEQMKADGLSDEDIMKIKIWQSDYPKEFPICGSWVIPSERFVAGQDCHDDQNPGSSSRDMDRKGSVYIKERNAEKHKNFNIELFTRTDGTWKIRLIMTSYSFMDSGAQGFPDGKSDCSKCTKDSQCEGYCTKSVPYQKAYDPNSEGYDTGDASNWIQGAYTRVHRNIEVINAMRTWMGLKELTHDELFGEEKEKAKKMGIYRDVKKNGGVPLLKRIKN